MEIFKFRATEAMSTKAGHKVRIFNCQYIGKNWEQDTYEFLIGLPGQEANINYKVGTVSNVDEAIKMYCQDRSKEFLGLVK